MTSLGRESESQQQPNTQMLFSRRMMVEARDLGDAVFVGLCRALLSHCVVKFFFVGLNLK
jgi:hypothetical protein